MILSKTSVVDISLVEEKEIPLLINSISKNLDKKTYINGHTPLLYMHPYEFLNDYEFWIPWKDFINLSLPTKLIKWTRQIQWLKVGNKNVLKKLAKIASIFEHQGPMKTFLET